MKRFFFILIIFLIFCSCGKGSKDTKSAGQTSVMDRIILNTLYYIELDASTVQRTDVADEIHYSVPLMSLQDLLLADRLVKDLVMENGLALQQNIQDTHTRIQRAYRAPVTNQIYVVDLFLIQARVGNVAQTEIPRRPENQSEIGTTGSQSEPTSVPQEYITPPVYNPLEDLQGRPFFSIIIDDFGSFDGPLLDAFCELPPSVAFAILPGLPFSQIAMRKAIWSGREVLVHMPMEADTDDVSPGHNAILSQMPPGAIYDRVLEYFNELNFAVGANNHMGSAITRDRALMRATFRHFNEKGVYFIDSRTTTETVAREIAREMGIPFAERDLFLDSPENTDEVLWERLRDLERLRDSQGSALVMTHCFDRGRLQRLIYFIEEAQKMGFVLVPVSMYVELSSELRVVSGEI